MLVTLLSLFSCSEGPAAPAPKAEAAPAPKPAGYFLLWYYPGNALYRSADGKDWSLVTSAPTEKWLSSVVGDSTGRLYAVKMGEAPGVLTSTDGTTWTEVAPNAANKKGEHRSYQACAGGPGELYVISGKGDVSYSPDAGQTWIETTRPVPEGAAGSGGGFEGDCAVAADGRVLVQGWYFDPAGPVLALSEDKGQTWQKVNPPVARNDSRGVGFVEGGLFYASADKVNYWTADNGATWTPATPNPLVVPNDTAWSTRVFASGRGKLVVGFQTPEGEQPGSLFRSEDGGKTYALLPLPWQGDPTPDTSDNYLHVAWVAGDAPGPMPAMASVAPAVVPDVAPAADAGKAPAAAPSPTDAAKPAEERPTKVPKRGLKAPPRELPAQPSGNGAVQGRKTQPTGKVRVRH